jgi:hypothetical protein
MTTKRCTVLACLLVLAPGVMAASAGAAAKKPTRREKAEAAKLVKTLETFRTAVAKRGSETDAALAAADAAAAKCPPPAGVPTRSPKSEAEYNRLYTAFSADLLQRSAAIFDPLATELADATSALRALSLRTADLKYLAREAADAAAETRALTPFDLCAFWTGWQTDSLDFVRGYARLATMAGGDAAFGDGPTGGEKRYDRALKHLRRIVGAKRAGHVQDFPVAGRYAPVAANTAFDRLVASYDLGF